MPPYRQAHQPLHPSVRPLLDPEYVAFHEEHLQYIPTLESSPWSPSIRKRSSPLSSAEPRPAAVGRVRDLWMADGRYQIRAYLPAGERPDCGWPAMIWLHGGGWVLGDLDSDKSFCTRVCRDVRCVVIGVNYRHAPEHPYPAAIEDVFDALEWVANSGPETLGINATRVALGGASAGGNLTAAAALKAAQAEPPIPLCLQLLVVPVLDNTATLQSTRWQQNQHAPWLTSRRMMWYRDLYVPHLEDRARWEVSPIFVPPDLIIGRKIAKVWIAVAGQDLVKPEGLEYAEILRQAGVQVEAKVYEGAPHMVMVMGEVMLSGRRLVADAIIALRRSLSCVDHGGAPIDDN